jgi:deazaflavin-dependent oxidoreductase (nitroreductase family)
MPAPRWLARFNLQVTNRLLGPLARHMPGTGVVVHVGRKNTSAVPHAVLVFRRGDRLIIALAYGRESQWVANVLAENGCELETGGRTFRLSHPRLLTTKSAGYAWVRPVHAGNPQRVRFPRALDCREHCISMIYASTFQRGHGSKEPAGNIRKARCSHFPVAPIRKLRTALR